MGLRGYKYEPDYAVPPGWLLKEMLETRGMNQAELARRCDRSRKFISEIVGGKAPIEPETAVQLERVLGMDARVWMNMQSLYELRQAEIKEREKLAASVEWAKRFPVKDLVPMKVMEKPADELEAVVKLLRFFGVASVEAWGEQFGRLEVSFRHSPTLESNREAIMAWLRIGERRAEQIPSKAFDTSKFRDALQAIRGLTCRPVREYFPAVVRLCAEAGVVVVFIPGLPKTRLSGAARWLSPERALIQMSLRHKTDGHFWFTFFHEAGHILEQRKRTVFVDDVSGTGTNQNANKFAEDFLIPRDQWARFVTKGEFSSAAITSFATGQGIPAGIVVGRLQHEGRIPYRAHNNLKRKIAPKDFRPAG